MSSYSTMAKAGVCPGGLMTTPGVITRALLGFHQWITTRVSMWCCVVPPLMVPSAYPLLFCPPSVFLGYFISSRYGGFQSFGRYQELGFGPSLIRATRSLRSSLSRLPR